MVQCRLIRDFVLESIQVLSLNELDTEHKFNFTSFKSILKYFMQMAQTPQTSQNKFQSFLLGNLSKGKRSLGNER